MNKIRIVLVLAAFLLLSGCVPTKEATVEDMYKYCDEGKYNGSYCLHLGLKFQIGSDGFEQSYTEAARFYALGCEFGHPRGCKYVTEMYEYGQHIDKNIDQAKYYYQKSCDQQKIPQSKCKDVIRLTELPRILSYLNENKKRKGVTVAEGGLQYEVIKTGAGKVSAEEIGFAEFNVSARLTNGSKVPSEYNAGEKPLTIPLDDIHKSGVSGLKNLIKSMKGGDQYRLYVPPMESVNYTLGLSDIPVNEVLILDIEMVKDLEAVWTANKTEYIGEIGVGKASHIHEYGGWIREYSIKQHLSVYYDQNSGEKGGWYFLLELQYPEKNNQELFALKVEHAFVKSEAGTSGDQQQFSITDKGYWGFVSKLRCMPSKENCVSVRSKKYPDPLVLRTGFIPGKEGRFVTFKIPLSNDDIGNIKKIADHNGAFLLLEVIGGKDSKLKGMNKAFYFTLNNFSKVFNELEDVANNFILSVNENGPLLRYQRDIKAFVLPHQGVRSCLIPEYEYPGGYSSDTVASIDSSYDLLRSQQEQCFNDIAKENFKAISDLINQLDGVWEWRRTDFLSGKFSKPLAGFASWSVPSNCAACKSGVTDVLNNNHSFLQSIDKARAETIESFREGRLKAIQEMLASKEDDARHKARMIRIKEERAAADAEYTRKSNEELRGQPSDGEVFLQELSNTVRQIDERARRRQMQEMENLSRQMQYEKQQTESSVSQGSSTSTSSENRAGGNCGSSPVAEFCAPDSPKPCNTCSEYQSWKDRWDAKCAARNTEHRAKQEAWARSCTSTENRPVLTKQK